MKKNILYLTLALMLYGTAQATGQTRYAFNPEDYVSTDNDKAPQDCFYYGDGYFRIAATGKNHVAFKMAEKHNGEYYITGDERWFLIKGSNLSTADGDTYLWWINGHNNGGQQVPPSYICSYGGSQYYIWNMECINSVFSWFRDNTGEKIILNGRDADWKLVTAAGLTALDGSGGTISDIGFYSDKEISDKYNVLAKYLSVSQYPYRVDVTADYITNPSFEANGGTTTGWTLECETTWKGVNEPSPGAGGDPQPTDGTHIFGVWDGGKMSASISQSITPPAGNYRLTVDMHASDNGGVRAGGQRVFAGNNCGYFAEQVEKNGTADNYPMQTISVDFSSDGNPINIGVATSEVPNANETWFKIDNFRLYQLTEETTPLSVAVMEVRQDVQYGTFCAPFEVAIPDGVTASTCTGTTGGVLEMAPLSNNIPANTPVILYAENGYPRTQLVGLHNPNSQEDLVTTPGNLLVGNVGTGAKGVPAGDNYLLQKQDDKVGFYKVNTSGRTIGYNRCYLSIPSNNARPSFFFDEDDFTGVTTLEQTEQDSPKDGIYFVNGKIEIVKGGMKYGINGQILK